MWGIGCSLALIEILVLGNMTTNEFVRLESVDFEIFGYLENSEKWPRCD